MNLPSIPISISGKTGQATSANISSYVGFVIPGIAIAVSILITVFVVWPKFNEVLAIKNENKNLEDLSVKLETKAEKLSSVDREKLITQLSQAEALLPSDKATFQFLRQVETTAATTGVLINRIDVSPGAVGNGSASKTPVPPPAPGSGNSSQSSLDAQSIELKMTIASDYRGLLAFINTMYSSPRVVQIKDFSTASSNALLATSVTLDAYWQPIPTELSSVESPIESVTAAESARLSAVNLENNTGISTTPLPQVPLGRSDLFAPF